MVVVGCRIKWTGHLAVNSVSRELSAVIVLRFTKVNLKKSVIQSNYYFSVFWFWYSKYFILKETIYRWQTKIKFFGKKKHSWSRIQWQKKFKKNNTSRNSHLETKWRSLLLLPRFWDFVLSPKLPDPLFQFGKVSPRVKKWADFSTGLNYKRKIIASIRRVRTVIKIWC